MRVPDPVQPMGRPTERNGAAVGDEVVLVNEGECGVYRGRGVGRELVRVEPTTVVPPPPAAGEGRERQAWGTRINRGDEFDALSLRLAHIPGRAIVRTGARAGRMSVQITGPDDLKRKVERYVSGDTLNVVGPASGAGGMGGTTVFSNRSGGMTVMGGTVAGTMSIIGGRVFVNGVEMTPGSGTGPVEQVEVVIDVPWRTLVTIEDKVGGEYELDDTEGALRLRLNGSGGVTAGRVGPAEVAIQGSSDVEIQSVTGQTMRVTIQGSGGLVVREGQVETLSLSVQGSGDAVYGGRAQHADLSVMGSGDIRVNQVTGSVSDRCLGTGDIRVHSRPQGDPNKFW